MSGDDSAILVTGATGFIGRQVVRRLLADGRPVVVLARARAGQAPAARVWSALGSVAPDARLTVVAGDLTELDGAAARLLGWLREAVGTVIHCAGDTQFFPADLDAFHAVHVRAPVALVAALAGGRLRHFAHLSTAFVCGRRGGRVLEEDRDVGQEFHNPYERAKLAAEIAVAKAGAVHGIDVRILRPSIVVGAPPTTAGAAPANLFFAFVRLLARAAARDRDSGDRPGRRGLCLPGAPAAPFNIVPVECVAAAAVALAEHPDATSGTFHLVTSEPPTQTEMLRMISGVLGLTGACVVDRNGGAEPASPLERRVAQMLGPYGDYLGQDVRFDDRRAREVLDRARIPPVTLDTSAVERLVELALARETVTP